MTRLVAVLFILLLIGPPLTVAEEPWSQMFGGPGKPSTTDIAQGTIDVLDRFSVHGPDLSGDRLPGQNYFVTPHGVIGFVRGPTPEMRCVMLVIDPAGTTTQTEIESCRIPYGQGYDAATDAMMLCAGGDAEHASVSAIDPKTGEARWITHFSELNLPPVATGDEGILWSCVNGAIDPLRRELVVPIAGTRLGVDYPTHRIASFSLDDGHVIWSSIVPVWAATKSGTMPPAGAEGAYVDAAGADYAPLGVTLTTTGVAVMGIHICPDATQCDDLLKDDVSPFTFHLSWLDRNGNVVGMQRTTLDPSHLDPTSPRTPTVIRPDGTAGSQWATASGSLAATVQGERLLIVDPKTPEIVRERKLDITEGAASGVLGLIGPSWSGDTILAPLFTSMVALRSTDLSVQWSWEGKGADWLYVTPMSLSDGGAWATVFHGRADRATLEPGTTNTDDARLFQFDAEGTVLQELPLPLRLRIVSEPTMALPSDNGYAVTWTWSPSYLPLGDGTAMMVGGNGDAIIVGPANPSRSPGAIPSTLFPAPGDPLTIQVDAGGASRIHITWGDGEAEVIPGGAPVDVSHTFTTTQQTDVRVTVESTDGTTATDTFSISVGGTPGVGRADHMEPLHIQDRYPGTGSLAGVNISSRPSLTPIEAFVSWGDGVTDRFAWNASTLHAVHRYDIAGEQEVAVTLVARDGSATTRTGRFDVGGSPPAPPELNFMQVAFSAEHAETTWGLLGVLMLMPPVAYGLYRQRRRQSVMHRRLTEIEAVRSLSNRDATESLRQLQGLRTTFRAELARGRMDDGQYRLLKDHVDEVRERLRRILILPLGARLSPSFMGGLDAAMQDGVVDDDEREALRSAIAAEQNLDPADRRTIEQILSAFS